MIIWHVSCCFQEFIEKVETFRPLINELNERSHDLDKEAAEKSHQLINELMTNVNHRWKELVGQTENKQMILQVINILIALEYLN